MIRWLYKNGNGTTELMLSEIAGKDLDGRVYVDSIEFRVTKKAPSLSQKEAQWNKPLGKLLFAFEFDSQTTIDIPYVEE